MGLQTISERCDISIQMKSSTLELIGLSARTRAYTYRYIVCGIVSDIVRFRC